MTVVWTDSALADLAEIGRVVDRLQPGRGLALIARVFERCRVLETFPRAGRVVPEFGLVAVRELIEAAYRIVYEVFPDRVEVIAVLHGRRRFPPD